MKMKLVYRTVFKVKTRKDSKTAGRHFWFIIRNDLDPKSEGETVSCGMPDLAEKLPIGSTYETVLTIPSE